VIFLHEAFGNLGPERDSRSITPDSIFGIASISKVLTATAVMLLVEEGRVGLNRPVQEYIPEFDGEGKGAITVRHLLTHTSGMRDKEVNGLEAEGGGEHHLTPIEPTQDPGMHEFLYYCYKASLWQPPETEFCYFNAGFDILGEIVRRVSGRSFSDFTRERIFLPLGMMDTYFSVPDGLRDRVVKYHLSKFDWDLMRSPCPAGCAFATTMDIAIFGQTFLNRGSYGDVHLLSPTTVNAMLSNQTAGIPGRLADGEIAPPWGLGWILFGDARVRKVPSLWSPQSYGHFGASGTALWVDPVYEIVGVFLSDTINEENTSLDLFIDAVTASIVEM
jgi:CubicO group peptidase (beta-lactamase class C family)